MVDLSRWFINSSSLSWSTDTGVESNSPTRNASTSTSCLLPPHLCFAFQNVALFSYSAFYHCRGSAAWCDARHPSWSQDLEVMHLRCYWVYLRRYGFLLFPCHVMSPAVAPESSILVAMRSRRYPISESLKPAAYNDLDLGIPLDIPQSQDPHAEEHVPSLEWGALAEEQTIELCEVKLRFDGVSMSMISITVARELLNMNCGILGLISQPLPPLHHPFPLMSGLTFVCSPPQKPDPSASPRTSPKRDKQPTRQVEPSSTFLVASFLDFEECRATIFHGYSQRSADVDCELPRPFCHADNTIPKSAVVTYTLGRASPSATSIKTAWVLPDDIVMIITNPVEQTTHQVGERSFFPHTLVLSCPAWTSTHPRKRGLIALLANASGPMSRRSQHAMEVVVGNMAVLRLYITMSYKHRSTADVSVSFLQT